MRHWVRDPALRSWPVLLLVALVGVPPIALVVLNNATESSLHDVAWIFAFYFAIAWLLLLGVIVRPQHVTRTMLAAVAGIGLVTEAPIAIFLETKLHSNTGNVLGSIFTIGVPEELAKAIPILILIAVWSWRRSGSPSQTPRDYLFLGAVSGLVFGAAEVVHYFNDYLGGAQTQQVNGPTLQVVTIQFIWRFLTDPISHACWAGITGYFIGVALLGRRYAIGVVGIAIAATLHGLNDWNPINSHPAWVLVTLVSVLLFLGYARAGAWVQAPLAATPLAATPLAAQPAFPPAAASPAVAAYGQTRTAQASGTSPSQNPQNAQDAWWQAPAVPPQPAYSSSPGAPTATPRQADPKTPKTPKTPKPWWEQ